MAEQISAVEAVRVLDGRLVRLADALAARASRGRWALADDLLQEMRLALLRVAGVRTEAYWISKALWRGKDVLRAVRRQQRHDQRAISEASPYAPAHRSDPAAILRDQGCGV